VTGAPPEYQVGLRENGAIVFLIDPENRDHRIEMTQMAVINKQGEISRLSRTRFSWRCTTGVRSL
jgi:hypothetical protein